MIVYVILLILFISFMASLLIGEFLDSKNGPTSFEDLAELTDEFGGGSIGNRGRMLNPPAKPLKSWGLFRW